jgi:hypothetical protein
MRAEKPERDHPTLPSRRGLKTMMGYKNSISFYLIALLLVGLMFRFRSSLMTNIVEPIALLCWAAWRVVSSVDQMYYWMVLIVICLLLVSRLDLSREDVAPRSAYRHDPLPLSRLEHWKRLIEGGALGGNTQAYLREGLKVCFWNIAAPLDRANETPRDELIADAKASLPPNVRGFLYPPDGRDVTSTGSRQPCIPDMVHRWIRRQMGMFYSQNLAWIDETLRWMENELEIHNDN